MYWTHWIQPKNSLLNEWDLLELEPFMLHCNVKIDLPSPKLEILPETTVSPPQIENKLSLYEMCKLRLLYVGKCQDPLFWSLYIYHYGMKEYIRIGKRNGNEEMKIKNEVVNHLLQIGAKQMTQLLDAKFTKVGCSRIAEDILTKPNTTMDLLYPYTLFFKCNLYVVDLKKKIYLKYAFQDTIDQTVIIYRNPETKFPEYFVDMQEQLYTLCYIQSEFLCLHSYAKPFKAISNFKLSELGEIAAQLGIDPEKKKKTELYDIMSKHCAWDL